MLRRTELIEHKVDVLSSILFTNFIRKYGYTLVQYFAFVTSNNAEAEYLNLEEPFRGALVEDPDFRREYLSTCWYGGNFFKWIIPNSDKLTIATSDVEIRRPKAAIGPYNYENVSSFSNNTIVHGSCESQESHFFFAVCMAGYVNIYNTYGGRCQMYMVRHTLEDANRMLRKLSTESDTTNYAQLAVQFFGYEKYSDEDDVFTFTLSEHAYWLPTPTMISQYVDVLLEYISNKSDRQVLKEIKEYLILTE